MPSNTTTGRTSQPSSPCLRMPFDDDPHQQCEEEQPDNQGDGEEMDGDRMREKPEEDLFIQNS